MNTLFNSDNAVLNQWKKLLRWNSWPDFGNCHQLVATSEYDEFYKRYLVTAELEEFSNNLAFKLENQVSPANWVLLKGNPGIGKTTFIYALLAHVGGSKKLTDKYVFSVCHANNINGIEWRKELFKHMKQGLKALFLTCNQKDAFDQLCCDGTDSEEGLEHQIRELKNYYVKEENREKFTKLLIFVFDNVDTVKDESRAIEAFSLINQSLEPITIKKWIAIRPETYNSYSSSSKKLMQSFVMEPMNLPKTSLYEIVCKRIHELAGDDKSKLNPFTEEVCDELIMPTCDGNLRKGFDVLQKLLEYSPPGGFSEQKNVSEKVLQNYLRKMVAEALYEADLLPNLHLPEYRMNELETPMIYDLLNLVNHSTNETTILGMLYETTDRRNRNIEYRISGRDNKYTIQNSAFNHGANTLCELGLCFRPEENTIVLTDKGRAVANIATSAHYKNLCLGQAEHKRSETYWQAASVDITYSTVAKLFITRPII